MDGHVLILHRRGISLLELSLGGMLVFAMAGAVATMAPAMVRRAHAERTLGEMSAMLEGGRQYDALHGAWPGSLAALQEVLPQAKTVNDWGEPFTMASSDERLWIETDLPVGALSGLMREGFVVVSRVNGKDRVRMATGRLYGPAGRLVYEKRNVYAP